MRIFYTLSIFTLFLTQAFASESNYESYANWKEEATQRFKLSNDFLQESNITSEDTWQLFKKKNYKLEMKWPTQKELEEFVEKKLDELRELEEQVKSEIGTRILNANDRYDVVSDHPSHLNFEEYAEEMIAVVKDSLSALGASAKVNIFSSIYQLPETPCGIMAKNRYLRKMEKIAADKQRIAKLKISEDEQLMEMTKLAEEEQRTKTVFENGIDQDNRLIKIAQVAYTCHTAQFEKESPVYKVWILQQTSPYLRRYAEAACNLIEYNIEKKIGGPYTQSCDSTLKYVGEIFDQFNKYVSDFNEVELESVRWLYNGLDLEEKTKKHPDDWNWYTAFWNYKIDETNSASIKSHVSIKFQKSSEFEEALKKVFWSTFQVLLADLYYQGFTPDDMRELTDRTFFDRRKTFSFINIFSFLNGYMENAPKKHGVYAYPYHERVMESINDTLDHHLAPKVKSFAQKGQEESQIDQEFLNMSPEERIKAVVQIRNGFHNLKEEYIQNHVKWNSIREGGMSSEQNDAFQAFQKITNMQNEFLLVENILGDPFVCLKFPREISDIDVSMYAKLIKIGVSAFDPELKKLYEPMMESHPKK